MRLFVHVVRLLDIFSLVIFMPGSWVDCPYINFSCGARTSVAGSCIHEKRKIHRTMRGRRLMPPYHEHEHEVLDPIKLSFRARELWKGCIVQKKEKSLSHKSDKCDPTAEKHSSWPGCTFVAGSYVITNKLLSHGRAASVHRMEVIRFCALYVLRRRFLVYD